ncbi:lysM domain receptor kinase [Trifolium repens]|nr:lysM domain receptor kinase [Trifolium repens]
MSYNKGICSFRDEIKMEIMFPCILGLAKGAAIGITIAGIFGLLLIVICIYVKYFQKKEEEKVKLPQTSIALSTQDGNASGSGEYETSGSSVPGTGSTAGLTGIMVAKSTEFSYQELAKATNNFSLDHKIGQGGFGAVYYAELRGEKTAIKKMDVQASTEFLCELKVLTHVHHLNLVRLIGYCVEGSLFLVYEHIDNGNLGEYLHGIGREPLPWSSRVQIALDSARGLEYIHEHTVPVYIHRDVKSANILIDKNLRGKVADFGLTKLIEVGNSTLHTRLVGTFGYMPPEYAQYGDVSPKIDVYAFGVVLYELISAKNAILKTGESVAESKGLVVLFEEALNQIDPLEGIRKLVDPRLKDNYPMDSVLKMVELARGCTRDNPLLRPTKEGDTYDLIANTYYVSKDYGLFITYPLRTGDTLQKIANESKLDEGLLQNYNPGVDFGKESGIVFIPGRDQNGNYVPLYPRHIKKKEEEKDKLPQTSMKLSTQDGSGEYETSGSSGAGSVAGLTGGFAAVYYAELRGEKTAIKKMDVQASTEFLCELKVLTHVHHLNLVRLIGYCVEGSLFLVYEHIDNGNLGQYLHGIGKEPLPWSSRVQIALDSARGLEYIHEHTVPVYIHRDVKSANILIDKNLRGKVADFGLTKLIEVGSSTLHTRLVGTFGYMPPEYAQYGDVSPKIDVYAFGVVLFELISAKNAVLRTGETVAESKGLVALFGEALNQIDPLEGLRKLVDPRLKENYPIEDVLKMAELGRACTRDNPLLRPSMRSIVVSLMTLSSPTEDCDDDTSYENQTIINLLSVR